MDYSSRQRFDEISKLRFDGNLAGAIELCQNAISAYPNDNFFYKVLGDLLFQEKNYVDASRAYIEQLKRLSEKPEHFKAFARFYRQFNAEAPDDFCIQFHKEIINAIDKGEIAPNIQQLLVETFGDAFIVDDDLKSILLTLSAFSWPRYGQPGHRPTGVCRTAASPERSILPAERGRSAA